MTIARSQTQLHLLQLGGVEQHRRALPGELAQQPVDLLLGARHRCRASGRSRGWCGPRRRSSGRSSPSAGCRRTGAAPRAGRGCRSAAARWRRRPGRAPRACRSAPSRCSARAERQGDVLAHRALHQQRLGAVAGHIGDAGARWRRRDGELHRLAVDLDRAAGRPDRAGQGGEQLVLALTLERDDAGDLAVAQRRRRRRSSLVPTPRLRTREAGRAGDDRGRAGVAAGGGAGAARSGAPSISSTILSSAPGAMSTTPTVSPSRSTVARSQSAEISRKRWEMKMTERPARLWRRTTSSTLSARLAGSAAVISSSSSTSGSIASARARSRTRSTASGMSRAVLARGRGRERRARAPSRGTAPPACAVSRRLAATSRSGISDGSW